MSKIAFLFPGQGSQHVGMGRQVFEATREGRETFEAADHILNMSLSKMCFEGPEASLRLTENTQPALLTVSTAIYRALRAVGIAEPDVCAGHSLGEYSAHVAAGTLTFEDALKLVRLRGQLMQTAVPAGEGAMAAILGGSLSTVEAVCRQEGVEPVNYNSPGQVVIAGKATAVSSAGEKLKQAGAKVVPLSVSAPFHSTWMRPAEENLRPHLERACFASPRFAVYTNVDAKPVTDAEHARKALIAQVSRPVLWQQTIEGMIQDGVKRFVEVGSGKVLTGLVGRIDKSVQRVSVQSLEDLPALKALLS